MLDQPRPDERGAPEAAQVRDEDAVAAESGDLRLPHRAGHGEGVEQDDRRPLRIAPLAYGELHRLPIFEVGLTALPLRSRTSKWRCGPVEMPVEPTRPIIVLPRWTMSPTFTVVFDMWP